MRYHDPYQGRHTYTTGLPTEGTSPWSVAKQLGHIDVEMKFKIYGKVNGEDCQKLKMPGSALRLIESIRISWFDRKIANEA